MAVQIEKGYTVLCASNAYVQKFYLNPEYDNLPKEVKEKLRVISVDYTEDIGGILLMQFNRQGKLVLESVTDGTDTLFDEAASDRKIKELSEKNQELFSKLEMYYTAMKACRSGAVPAGLDLSVSGQEGEPGARNPEGHAEVRRASKEEIEAIEHKEEAEVKPTGSWDMPVAPDDEDAEQTAYHTLFGE